MTVSSAKAFNRKMGNTKWYRSNKDALVATLVLDGFVLKIQRFYRDSAASAIHNRACPISLVPILSIPVKSRFRHLNTWFDKNILAQHMHQTNDFVNPVTRVEFDEDDIIKIDPNLVESFKNRVLLRACLAEDMELVQSVENELEEVFKYMVEAAQEIPSRIEFRIVFDNLTEDFQQCHTDLVRLDSDRSNLTLKSLGGFLEGDPNRPVHMSAKRKGILLHFLQSQK